MTDSTRTEYDRQPIPDDQAVLQSDIEETRARMGETVDEIGRRLDVKARVRELKQDATQRVDKARQTATDAGRRAGVYGRSNPMTVAVVAAVVAATITLLLGRRRRSRSSAADGDADE